MNQEINHVLTALAIQPVLVDIGASGMPPKDWQAFAQQAVYVGFDPDQRQPIDIRDGEYARSIIVNAAVVDREGDGNAHFYLTRSPHCSSTLLPDAASLADYIFSDLFIVEGEATVPALTLSTVLEDLDLSSIDWLKTDSQGTDLRLYQSLPDDLRRRVLALDIEPGLIDAYQGEDLFVDAHRQLLNQGLWLSSLEVKGSVRMRRTTLSAMAKYRPDLIDTDISTAACPSPGWVEARYLRTLESLEEEGAGPRDYALLWGFAMIGCQWGYALDIACAYEQKFGHDSVSDLLRDLPLSRVAKKRQHLRTAARRLLPSRFRSFLRQMLRG